LKKIIEEDDRDVNQPAIQNDFLHYFISHLFSFVFFYT